MTRDSQLDRLWLEATAKTKARSLRPSLDDGNGIVSVRFGGPDGHTGSVTGALVWGDYEGVSSWSDDRSLMLWYPDGTVRSRFLGPDGHTGRVTGAVVWGDHEGVLSWSVDGSLILRKPDGTVRWRVSMEFGITAVALLTIEYSHRLFIGLSNGTPHWLTSAH